MGPVIPTPLKDTTADQEDSDSHDLMMIIDTDLRAETSNGPAYVGGAEQKEARVSTGLPFGLRVPVTLSFKCALEPKWLEPKWLEPKWLA